MFTPINLGLLRLPLLHGSLFKLAFGAGSPACSKFSQKFASLIKTVVFTQQKPIARSTS